LGLSLDVGRNVLKNTNGDQYPAEKNYRQLLEAAVEARTRDCARNCLVRMDREKGQKQPCHIHRADGKPLYLAALANVAPPNEYKASNRLTIVTADPQGGLLDVHDRRPVVLSAADAALWLDEELPWEQAERL
jgi:putative SOS response-associated peptidase YedK